jgi:hypothetical protein
MTTLKSRWLKAALWTAGVSALLTGLIGFAHTPQGRPLLAWLSGVPGCPVLANVSPLQVEEHRMVWATRKAGDALAPARPALAFELGKSRRAEVAAELERRGASCKAARKDTALECTTLEGRPADDALLQFDADGKLRAVDVFHRTASSEVALGVLEARRSELAKTLGAASSERGRRDAAHLAATRFRQVVVEYRYRDYSARVAATNFGSDLRVREQYDLL